MRSHLYFENQLLLNLCWCRYRRGRAPSTTAPEITSDAAATERKKPTCKICGERQLGHASKRHPRTGKKKKYPCGFTPEELKEFDEIAITNDT